MSDSLWCINADGTITIPHSVKVLDTPIFLRAAIDHNDRLIALHAVTL